MTEPTTITLAEMERDVADGADIELPGPEGGWAVAVINGRSYRARVGAAASGPLCLSCGIQHDPPLHFDDGAIP